MELPPLGFTPNDNRQAVNSCTSRELYQAREEAGECFDALKRLRYQEEIKTLKTRRHFLRVWMLVGVGILVSALAYLLNVLALVVGILLWTLIIVFCLRGVVAFIEKAGFSRLIGTSVAYLLMFAILLGLGTLLFSPVFGLNEQTAAFLRSIPSYVEQLIRWGNDLYVKYDSFLQNATIHRWMEDAANSVTLWAASVARDSATNVITASSSFATALMSIAFALVIAFWILVELPDLGRECLRLAGPRYHDDLEMLHLSFSRVMGGYIRGTLLQCVIIGAACTVCYGIVGIPSSIAIGIITGMLNIIPVIGPWLGGIIALLIGILVEPWVGIVAFLGAIIIQQFVYTFISPRIMASSVDIHPVLILVSLLVGSALGNFMSGMVGAIVGMLAAIPVLAWLKSVFVYYFEKHTKRRIVSEDGVFFQGTPQSEGIDPLSDATAPSPDARPEFVSQMTDAFRRLRIEEKDSDEL